MRKSPENKQLSEEQVIKKLESFCAYRERCMSEVRQRLYQLGVPEKEEEVYLSYLMENNYLNEDRFAASFARGKFNIKSWGRRRIEQELKGKKIDDKKISQSIGQIDAGMYFLRLQDVLAKKNRLLKEPDAYKRKNKLIQFALQKGYEMDLINEALKIIIV